MARVSGFVLTNPDRDRVSGFVPTLRDTDPDKDRVSGVGTVTLRVKWTSTI
jgi:hypothetical protein